MIKKQDVTKALVACGKFRFPNTLQVEMLWKTSLSTTDKSLHIPPSEYFPGLHHHSPSAPFCIALCCKTSMSPMLIPTLFYSFLLAVKMMAQWSIPIDEFIHSKYAWTQSTHPHWILPVPNTHNLLNTHYIFKGAYISKKKEIQNKYLCF